LEENKQNLVGFLAHLSKFHDIITNLIQELQRCKGKLKTLKKVSIFPQIFINSQ
jgi:hypothetical protein